jgi:hypothetical protein
MTFVFLTFLGSPTNFPLEFRFGFFQNESFNFYPSILQFFSALEVRKISLFIRNLKMGNAVLVLDGLTIFSKDLHSVFKNDFQKMFFHYISAASRRKMVAKIVLLMQQQKGAMLPQYDSKKLPQMVKRLEKLVYRSVSSFEVNNDMNTLQFRLQHIAMIKTQLSQPVPLSSSAVVQGQQYICSTLTTGESPTAALPAHTATSTKTSRSTCRKI